MLLDISFSTVFMAPIWVVSLMSNMAVPFMLVLALMLILVLALMLILALALVLTRYSLMDRSSASNT